MRQIAVQMRVLVLASVMLASGSAVSETVSDILPYIGFDYYHAWMKGKSSWNLVFPKTYPGASVYVGSRFHDFCGIELGYDASTRQKRDWTLASGSTFFSSRLTQSISGTTKVRRNGGHVDLVGFLPVVGSLELLGSVGAGWIQTKIETAFTTGGSSTVGSALASVAGKGRMVFRVGLGASYMVTDMVGIRALVRWEGTSSLQVKGNANFANLGYDAKAFKGTTAMSAGAFVKF